jgi:hypothetical protein
MGERRSVEPLRDIPVMTKMIHCRGGASGRTFNRMSTHLPDTCWSSLSVTSSHTLNMSIQSPSETLKSGLPMPVFATVSLAMQYQKRSMINSFIILKTMIRKIPPDLPSLKGGMTPLGFLFSLLIAN